MIFEVLHFSCVNGRVYTSPNDTEMGVTPSFKTLSTFSSSITSGETQRVNEYRVSNAPRLIVWKLKFFVA